MTHTVNSLNPSWENPPDRCPACLDAKTTVRERDVTYQCGLVLILLPNGLWYPSAHHCSRAFVGALEARAMLGYEMDENQRLRVALLKIVMVDSQEWATGIKAMKTAREALRMPELSAQIVDKNTLPPTRGGSQ